MADGRILDIHVLYTPATIDPEHHFSQHLQNVHQLESSEQHVDQRSVDYLILPGDHLEMN